MKKPYSEPDILFESFALSTSIAAGCEETPYNSTDNCGILWGSSVIFISKETGCSSIVNEGDGTYNKLCYHTPYESYNVLYS